MPRIPSGIVRTLLGSFNPFVHRSIPSCIDQSQFSWVRTLQNGIEPFRRGFKPNSDCPDTEHERFNPSKTGSKRGFGAKKPFQDGFQVNRIGFGGSEDEKRGFKIGFERSGDGFEPFRKGSNDSWKGLNASRKGSNALGKGSNDLRKGCNDSEKGSNASGKRSNDLRKRSNDSRTGSTPRTPRVSPSIQPADALAEWLTRRHEGSKDVSFAFLRVFAPSREALDVGTIAELPRSERGVNWSRQRSSEPCCPSTS